MGRQKAKSMACCQTCPTSCPHRDLAAQRCPGIPHDFWSHLSTTNIRSTPKHSLPHALGATDGLVHQPHCLDSSSKHKEMVHEKHLATVGCRQNACFSNGRYLDTQNQWHSNILLENIFWLIKRKIIHSFLWFTRKDSNIGLYRRGQELEWASYTNMCMHMCVYTKPSSV